MSSDRVIERLRSSLAGRRRKVLPVEDRRPAAVLVPLVERPGGLELLFTRRTARVSSHAGQICFPGGGPEPADRDLAATALRETREEIGLAPEAVELLGALDDCRTFSSAYLITPFVGYVARAGPLAPAPDEVAEILSVPLAELAVPGAYGEESWAEYGLRLVAVYRWRGQVIWGATARMLRGLLALLGPERTID
ncbi:MAG: CoA pyrophosphatase [Planctomycetes bacterium]|nr:CoA pyrophosphatase [Planctomycetota bacterium]